MKLTPFRIALIYLIFAVVWIGVSDAVLVWFTDDVQQLSGETIQEESIRSSREGIEIPVMISSVPIIVDDEVIGIYAMYVDLSEQNQLQMQISDLLVKEKQARKEVEQSKLDLEEVFESAPSAIAITESAAHRYKMANPAYMKLMGKENLVGHTIKDMLPELIDQGYQHILDHVFHSGELYSASEEPVMLSSSETGALQQYYLNYIFKPLKNSGGEIHGIFIEAIDVTEQVVARKTLKASLEEKEILLQEVHHRVKNNLAVIAGLLDLQMMDEDNDVIINHLREAQSRIYSIAKVHEAVYQEENVVRVQLDKYISMMAISVSEQLGYEEEFDALTKLAAYICDAPVSLLNMIDESRQWAKSMHGLGEGAREMPRNKTVCQYTILGTETVEVQDLAKDDRFSMFSYVQSEPNLKYYLGAPLIDPDGYAIGAICVLDYKAREMSEEQKKALKILSTEVMARLELRRQNKELEELNSYKTRLLKMLSHDMRSPLNGIIGMSGIIKDELKGSDAEMYELVDIMEQSAFQLNHMIDEMLSYTIIESKGFRLDLKPTPLDETIDQLKKLYESAAKTKKVTLKLGLENIKAPVLLDTEKIEQVLGNLISNAIKFTRSGGVVSLSISKNNSEALVIKVSDTGVGMDSATISTLSDDKSRKHKSGTQGEKSSGIGLSIVKYFTELHYGQIDVESEIGKGTTFTVTIPKQSD
jgi:signal transduction histidine kinase